MSTKNIGQVSGLHIGVTPPINTVLIWYDSTPSQRIHKVFNPTLNLWTVLDKNAISNITYSELVNLATSVGLSIGSWFKISDKGNALALVITTTKVQYNDVVGNILIDDLGTNIQYHVTSSNLSIDDVVGVFDLTNNKLVFQFNEVVPEFNEDTFLLGKEKKADIWSLVKFKISAFLSKVTGNSITWNGGFFFNFKSEIDSILDKTGGVVSKDSHDTTISSLTTAINNVGEENQEIIHNAEEALKEQTTDAKIFNKTLTSGLEIGGTATDIAKGDTLYAITTKLQRWINRFKYASGISMSRDYSVPAVVSNVNNNDTVEAAVSKLQAQSIELKRRQDNLSFSLPDDWEATEEPTEPRVLADDSYEEAFKKIEWFKAKYHNLENTGGTVRLEHGTSTEMEIMDGITYKIANGVLEIVMRAWFMLSVIYTRAYIYDRVLFMPFKFSKTFTDKIQPFLPGFGTTFSSDIPFVLAEVGTCSLYEQGTVVVDGITTSVDWSVPKVNMTASVSLSYINSGGTAQLGLSIAPLTKSSVDEDGKLVVARINNNTTFSDLLGNTYNRFQLHPFTIRYKIW